MATLTSDEVTTATDDLVAAFAATDTAAYFACFSPGASFVFCAAACTARVRLALPPWPEADTGCPKADIDMVKKVAAIEAIRAR